MQHAKKMVLVPHESIHRLGAGNTHGSNETVSPSSSITVHSVQTAGTPLSRLDAEMSEILNSCTYDNEHAKWSAYNQVLQRYLRLVQHHTDSNKLRKEEEAEEEDGVMIEEKPVTSLNTDSRLNDTLIIDSVPKKFHLKAKMLLRSLLRNTSPLNKISWDSRGVVSIGGRKIPNSNIVDLVNDAMRARERIKPPGRALFAAHLRRIQTPLEFIGNPELLQEGIETSTPHRRLIAPNPGDSGSVGSYKPSTGSSPSSNSSDYEESEFRSGSATESPIQKGKGQHNADIKPRVWISMKL